MSSEHLSFIKFIIERDINIIKKNWNTEYPGYQVEFNDQDNHSLIDRVRERTTLAISQIIEKFDKAIRYIIKKNEKSFFKNKTMVSINMKKSNFKVMILIDPVSKYIRVSTVLSSEQYVKNAIRWELDERYNEQDFDYLEIDEDEIYTL